LVNLGLEATAVFPKGAALLSQPYRIGSQGVVLRLQTFVPPGSYARGQQLSANQQSNEYEGVSTDFF
jgi:hypothetical protein